MNLAQEQRSLRHELELARQKLARQQTLPAPEIRSSTPISLETKQVVDTRLGNSPRTGSQSSVAHTKHIAGATSTSSSTVAGGNGTTTTKLSTSSTGSQPCVSLDDKKIRCTSGLVSFPKNGKGIEPHLQTLSQSVLQPMLQDIYSSVSIVLPLLREKSSSTTFNLFAAIDTTLVNKTGEADDDYDYSILADELLFHYSMIKDAIEPLAFQVL